jgi:hypothetical protein
MKNGQVRSAIFRDITQSRVLIPYKRFGKPVGPIFKVQDIPLKKKQIGFPETSVDNYHSTYGSAHISFTSWRKPDITQWIDGSCS